MTLTRHASRTAAALLFGTLIAGGVGATAFAADEAPAAAAPKPGARWTLGLTHGALKRAVVAEKTYYYMTLTVKNATGLPRDWRPLVVARTDTTHPTYVAGGFAPALEEIRRVEDDKTLQPVESSGWQAGDGGKIQNGETKKTVAIFGPIDPHWSKFRIEVTGLVNPQATLKVRKYSDTKYVVSDTAYDERNEKVMKELREEAAKSGGQIPTPTPEYREVVEDRAWVMQYCRCGDEFQPEDDPIQFVRERWEILGEPKVIRVIPSKV